MQFKKSVTRSFSYSKWNIEVGTHLVVDTKIKSSRRTALDPKVTNGSPESCHGGGHKTEI